MKKLLLSTVIALFVVAQIAAKETITLTAGTYTIDTLAKFPIGPGAEYYSLRLLTGEPSMRRLDVFCTKVDLNNPTTTLQTVLGCDSILRGEKPSSMAKRHSNDERTFFTGSNGDFYITSGDVGLPVGNNVINSEFARTPNSDRPSAMYGEDGKMHFGIFKFAGKVKYKEAEYELKRVNYVRNTNQLVLFNKHNGTRTRTNEHGTELRVALCSGEEYSTNGDIKVKVLAKAVNKGNSKIENGEMILSGHGTAADFLNTIEEGEEITISLSSMVGGSAIDISNAVTGDPYGQMIKDGVVESQNFWNENHPRTGIGTTIKGDSVIFCVVDGRGASNGCTTLDLGRIMKAFGAYNAVNLDGGGSSSLYGHHFDQMNRPSDGTERAVANGIFAVSNTPKDLNVVSFAPYVRNLTVPRYVNIEPKFLGYNKYGVLVDTLLQGVTLSCDKSLGHINEDGTFTASGNKDGRIEVKFGEYSTFINVKLTTIDALEFPIDTVITDHNERNVTVSAVSNGVRMNIDPAVLNYTSSDESVCLAYDGMMKGVKEGVVTVKCELEGFEDEVAVKVQIPNNGIEQIPNISSVDGYKVKSASSSWNTKWNAKTATEDANISFTYTSGRAPFVRIEKDVTLYSIPDSMVAVINTNAPIAGMQHSWRFNGEDKVTDQYDNVTIGKDHRFTLYTEDRMPKWDQSLFPIVSESFNFTLISGDLVKGTDYKIYFKELAVYYKGMSVNIPLVEESSNLELYPNPVGEGKEINVAIDGDDSQEIRIYDMNGRIVLNTTVSPTMGWATVNVANLTSGAYVVSCSGQTANIVIK